MYISHFKNSKLVQTLLKYVEKKQKIFHLILHHLIRLLIHNSFAAQLTAVRNI